MMFQHISVPSRVSFQRNKCRKVPTCYFVFFFFFLRECNNVLSGLTGFANEPHTHRKSRNLEKL